LKILILDDDSQVGDALTRVLALSPDMEFRVIPSGLLSGAARGVSQQIAYFAPDFIVNTYSVELAELPRGLDKSHTQLVKELCRVASAAGSVVIHISSAMVFDSARGGLFSEHDKPRPRSVVSRALVELERSVMRHSERHIILRCGWIFGPHGAGMFKSFLRRLELGQETALHPGLLCAPTPSTDVARVVCAMIRQLECGADCWGTYHYSSSDTITSRGFAETVVTLAANYGQVDLANINFSDSDQFEHYGVPYHPILECRKILNCYGIKQRPWRSALTTILKAIYQSEEGDSQAAPYAQAPV
jgi:dTDP-4-dehydrorhamnose reductase